MLTILEVALLTYPELLGITTAYVLERNCFLNPEIAKE